MNYLKNVFCSLEDSYFFVISTTAVIIAAPSGNIGDRKDGMAQIFEDKQC